MNFPFLFPLSCKSKWKTNLLYAQLRFLSEISFLFEIYLAVSFYMLCIHKCSLKCSLSENLNVLYILLHNKWMQSYKRSYRKNQESIVPYMFDHCIDNIWKFLLLSCLQWQYRFETNSFNLFKCYVWNPFPVLNYSLTV